MSVVINPRLKSGYRTASDPLPRPYKSRWVPINFLAAYLDAEVDLVAFYSSFQALAGMQTVDCLGHRSQRMIEFPGVSIIATILATLKALHPTQTQDTAHE